MHEKIEVVCDKVQNHKQYIQDGSISVVFCNPPYFKNGTATKNQSQEIAIARHEEFLPLADLCCVSSKMLKFGGKFYVVYPASRLAELIFELKTLDIINKPTNKICKKLILNILFITKLTLLLICI
jgi:tRNA1(Val) A37 N6-methylase TrmN6